MQTTLSKPAAPILPLTSVRFLAAFYVVLHHSNLWRWDLPSSTFLGRFLRSGHIAVGFFFVLSGFILALVYLDGDRKFSTRKFWIARFARAYPLLLFSVILAAPIMLGGLLKNYGFAHALRTTLINVVKGAMVLQAWATRFRMLNPPAWSLSCEAFFYLCFPFTAFWIWRNKPGRNPVSRAFLLLALFWGLSLLVPIAVTHHNPNASDRIQFFVQLAPIFRIWEFFAGIALCSLHRTLAATRTAAERSRFAYRCFFASIAFFLLVIAFAAHIPTMVLNNGVLLPAFCLLIFSLANAQGSLALFFSHRWFVVLGEVSYAVYLIHSPIYSFIDHFHRIDNAGLWFVFLAVLMAASFAAYFGIERPLRIRILALTATRPHVIIQQEAVAPN